MLNLKNRIKCMVGSLIPNNKLSESQIVKINNKKLQLYTSNEM